MSLADLTSHLWADRLWNFVNLVTGAMIGYAATQLKEWRDLRRKREGMRKALYYELTINQATCRMVSTLSQKAIEPADWLKILAGGLSTGVYDAARVQFELFYSLKEAKTVDELYISVCAIKNHYVLPFMGKAAIAVAGRFIKAMDAALAKKRLDPDLIPYGMSELYMSSAEPAPQSPSSGDVKQMG